MQQFHLSLDNATAKGLVVLAKKTERSKSAILRHLVKRELVRLAEAEGSSDMDTAKQKELWRDLAV